MFKDIKAKLKNSWKSFTNWFNAVGASILQILMAEPTLQEYLSLHDLVWVMVIGNILLRFKTSNSLADK